MNSFEEPHSFFKTKDIQKKNIFQNWVKTPLADEGGEVERVIKLHTDFELSSELKSQMLEAYENTNPIRLTDEVWSQLENTDSFNLGKGDMDSLQAITEQTGRNHEVLIDAITSGKEMSSPIIAKLPQGEYHLVSGNTRLCVSRVLGETPDVYILDLSQLQ